MQLTVCCEFPGEGRRAVPRPAHLESAQMLSESRERSRFQQEGCLADSLGQGQGCRPGGGKPPAVSSDSPPIQRGDVKMFSDDQITQMYVNEV